MSTSGDPLELSELERAGVEFVAKPFVLRDFEQRVAGLLERRDRSPWRRGRRA